MQSSEQGAACLGFRVERGGCFIADEQPRLPEEGARNRHALLLAPAQLEAALAHN